MAYKELRAIVDAHARARQQNRPAALVTVVRTSGSTYRRPGARMLVLAAADGGGRPDSVGADFLGSISGGCLEDDAREHALATLATGRAAIVRYDTTADGDIVYGTGLGCRGVVEILVEPLPADSVLDPVACIAHSLQTRRPGALASVIGVESADAKNPTIPFVGQSLWLASADDDNPTATTLTDPGLAHSAIADARAALRGEARAGTRAYLLPGGGRVEIYLDVIRPPRGLLICGAGHDAVPLARLGKELGWQVRVVDGRRAYLVPARFPDVDELTHCPPAAFAERIAVETGEAAVLMTHNYLHDRAILRALLGSPAGYIGVLGPRARTEQLLSELAAADADGDASCLGKHSLRRLHSPCGLDIGAEAPEQIALAIMAEIVAVGAGREGGLLKRRAAPLHAAAPL